MKKIIQAIMPYKIKNKRSGHMRLGVHTHAHTHTCARTQSDFKKPDSTCTWFKNSNFLVITLYLHHYVEQLTEQLPTQIIQTPEVIIFYILTYMTL